MNGGLSHNADELDYKKYLRKQSILSSTKNLAIKVDSYMNLPFDFDYDSWGRRVERSDDQIIINNVTVGSNIDSILVKIINSDKFKVLLNINDGTVLTFTDYKHSNELFSKTLPNGKKYYFDSMSNPIFQFENYTSNDLIFKIKGSTKEELNIATLDIETYIHDSKHSILCICMAQPL